ncbi:hypothetical protein SAMN05444149_10114 [Pseudosulfitobacter pseudonitzschiae]|uniref:Uncharacterized protein n=1 Tax=Pseudosulfitobacter pseudonitzschiae TaxID=1402135 RepID=A0A073J8I0_9RHOB|nr:hypothetical protein [Pseudosulfitobacter pseudonitzschiae]KEJ98269.1 hypothetical protein SUH3_04540 [Pseudosulfitobacter pseudonitzschiae]SHE40716.1 hypothetical protein SAMN05444149_10114 [Pseudosulfitobacter pseudonitzschiae]
MTHPQRPARANNTATPSVVRSIEYHTDGHRVAKLLLLNDGRTRQIIEQGCPLRLRVKIAADAVLLVNS